ncbi:31242_t:CDS:2, partial [Gigaspora margarita]
TMKKINISSLITRSQVDPTIDEEVIIIVNIDGELKELKLKKSYNLKRVREELETNKLIEIADKVVFMGREGAEITIKSEESFNCADILNEGNKISLKRLDWCILGKKFNLGNGRTITYEGTNIAIKRAFIIEKCELLLQDDAPIDAEEAIESHEDDIRNKNLLFTTDVDIKSLVKLGMTMESKKGKQSHFKLSSTFKYRKRGKACLKIIDFSPTEEFKNAVKDALNSENINKLEMIKDEFGTFIPTIIKFGGRFHYKNEAITTTNSKNNETDGRVKVEANGQKLEFRRNANKSYEKESKIQHQILEIYGGDKEKLKGGDEETWESSLRDLKKWEPIEFQQPKSIFQILLPSLDENLQIKIKNLFGKRIIYSGEQELEFVSEDYKRKLLHKLKIPRGISLNFNRDCQIFATVSNIEKSNDIFTFRLHAVNKSNFIAINCIRHDQKKKPRKYSIMIRWIVVGYDFDFNYTPSDFNIRLHSFKEEINPNNIIGSINSHTLKIHEWKASEFIKCDYLLGVPVFKTVECKYDSLIIGNYFCRCNDKISTYIYGYDLHQKKYSTCATLPNFEFNFLHFLDPPDNSIYNKFTIEYPKKKLLKDWLKLNNQKINNDTKSKFANLYSTDEAQCSPKFIGQNREEFIMEQLKCTCECKISEQKITYEAEYFSPNITYEKVKSNSNYNEN